MFPLAHMYLADKYFHHINDEIKLGSIIPDFIALSPNYSISESHVLLNNFIYQNFERAWNLHVIVDKYSEENYFYRLIPKNLKTMVGEYLGHIFVETALDYIIWENDIYFSPPKINDKILISLEKYFNKDLTLIKPSINLFITWDRDSYLNHLAYTLLYLCGVSHRVLTVSRVKELINECNEHLLDYKLMLNNLLSHINEHDLNV